MMGVALRDSEQGLFILILKPLVEQRHDTTNKKGLLLSQASTPGMAKKAHFMRLNHVIPEYVPSREFILPIVLDVVATRLLLALGRQKFRG